MLTRAFVEGKVFTNQISNKIISRFSNQPKGVNLLEYALLAMLVIAIFAIVAYFFKSTITGLFSKTTACVNNNTGGNTGNGTTC